MTFVLRSSSAIATNASTATPSNPAHSPRYSASGSMPPIRGRISGFGAGTGAATALLPPENENPAAPPEPERRIAARAGIEQRGRAADGWLAETVRWTWNSRLLVHLELDITQRLREAAEAEAIRVFGRNLSDLLLAAPAGQRVTMGLDPGIRTGVKVAVVDGTGKLGHAGADLVVVGRHEVDHALEPHGQVAEGGRRAGGEGLDWPRVRHHVFLRKYS